MLFTLQQHYCCFKPCISSVTCSKCASKSARLIPIFMSSIYTRHHVFSAFLHAVIFNGRGFFNNFKRLIMGQMFGRFIYLFFFGNCFGRSKFSKYLEKGYIHFNIRTCRRHRIACCLLTQEGTGLKIRKSHPSPLLSTPFIRLT